VKPGRNVSGKQQQKTQGKKTRKNLHPKVNKSRNNPHDHLFELSIDILSITGFDGAIKEINPAFKRIFGFTEKELKSKPALQFVHPDDRKKVREALKRLSRRESIRRFESRGLCKDGSYKWIAWIAHSSPKEKTDLSRWP